MIDNIPINLSACIQYLLKAVNVHFSSGNKSVYAMVPAVPVTSFETDEFYIDIEAKIPILFENIIWIDDDFLNDENIEFDFEAFDIIDSGEIYINPKHFSVLDLVGALQR